MSNDLFGASDVARSAAIENAGKSELVGSLIDIENATDQEHGDIATYLFESSLPGYKGWRWAVTLSRTDGDLPTVSDVVLLPGPDALLAPKWIPYNERLQPGDVGVGDIVPTSLDDSRLTTGEAALPGDEELDLLSIDLLWENGLGRKRILSIEGRDQASKRWYEGDRGPESEIA